MQRPPELYERVLRIVGNGACRFVSDTAADSGNSPIPTVSGGLLRRIFSGPNGGSRTLAATGLRSAGNPIPKTVSGAVRRSYSQIRARLGRNPGTQALERACRDGAGARQQYRRGLGRADHLDSRPSLPAQPGGAHLAGRGHLGGNTSSRSMSTGGRALGGDREPGFDDTALAGRRRLRRGDRDRFPGHGAGIYAIIGGPSAPRAPDPA